MILKKYRFVVECTYDIEDLTKEVVRRSLKRHPDYEDVIEDKKTWKSGHRRKGRDGFS